MASNTRHTNAYERFLARIPPRLETWWDTTRSSLWFLPTIAVLLAVVLALVMVYIDFRFEDGLRDRRTDYPWLFGAGSDGARGVLTAIAGSVMTVIGTVFSITIVGLQLASSQFTPRVLRQFTGDRVNQTVLAVYIGTFTYSILVLRTVRDDTDSLTGFIPFVSVAFAIVLALVCILMLILFIHHMSMQMQVSFILHRATEETMQVIDSYFRDEIEMVPQAPQYNYGNTQGFDVLSDSTGYLQHYDYDHLLDVAGRHKLTVRMLVPMGAYLNRRQAVARVWAERGEDGEEPDLEDAADAVRRAIVTGSERTLASDLPFGVRQIADIALKALSPGINDPTTATQALDRLSEVLAHAGRKEAPVRILYADDRPVVFLPRIGFSELTSIAFTQIRHYGKADLVVMTHLARTIERIASLVSEKNQQVLVRHLELTRAAGEQGLEVGPDQQIFVETVDASLARIARLQNGERVPDLPDFMQVG
ncbi:MAG: DUF2254 domain-containing protein [Gemmatimonadetes bacterium]|nr:DUF2254 domain-containing protein [Gemmatimonadota bacterium]